MDLATDEAITILYEHKKTSAGSRGNFLINQSHKKEKIIIKRRNPSLAHKLDMSAINRNHIDMPVNLSHSFSFV